MNQIHTQRLDWQLGHQGDVMLVEKGFEVFVAFICAPPFTDMVSLQKVILSRAIASGHTVAFFFFCRTDS